MVTGCLFFVQNRVTVACFLINPTVFNGSDCLTVKFCYVAYFIGSFRFPSRSNPNNFGSSRLLLTPRTAK